MTPDLRDQLQQTLGTAFTVERELGGGGMSRVFVATDTTLDRQIVVKMVPPQAAQSVSVERFNREIRVAARLQHPHIVPVLSAGESGGLPFYTMPFVAGESLRHRLAKGGELSINESVHILRDIAAALAYAHGQGVVHRDIKPENVMLSGGVAVVTDFGVAKAMDLSITDGGHVATGLTSLGVALGTPAYMSPEQATGDPHVDHRSDIYSFGCVAYEMLTGSSPFAGRAPQQLLAAHVQDAVEPVERRRPSVPPPFAALVMSCLEKRAGDRPQSAEELIAALDAIATPSGGMSPTLARLAAAKPRRVRWNLVAGAAGVVAVGVVAAVLLMPAKTTPLQFGPSIEVATGAELELEPAISPDGKLVAYRAGPVGQERIYVRQVSGGRTLLTGDLDGSHGRPVWSPDGSTIMFAQNAEGTGGSGTNAIAGYYTSLYTVPMMGGTPRLLFSSDTVMLLGPAWSPDGRQVAYADVRGIRVRAIEGGPERTLVPTGSFLHSPSWSPDGRWLAFLEGNPTTLSNVSVSRVAVVNVETGERIDITDASHVITSPVWMPDGASILYVSNRDGSPEVFQQSMRSGRPIGDAMRLTTGLNARTISLSADGARMAYDVVRNRSNIWMLELPRSGAASMSDARPVTNGYERVEAMRLSHDGNWLAYDSDRGGSSDIYKIRLDGGEPIRLTNTPDNEFSPAWSPDDRDIAYHVVHAGARNIHIITSDGSGERQVTSGARQDYWPDWSPDGRSLVFGISTGSTWRNQISTQGAEGWTDPQPVGESALQGSSCARWSPSGREIASTLDGRLALIGATDGASHTLIDMRLSGEPAAACAWGRIDRLLYYNTFSANGRYSFWVIPATGGTPRLVLRDTPERRLGRWDFETDGRRLFFTLTADESDVWVREISK